MNRFTLSLSTLLIVSVIFLNCAQSNSKSRRPVTTIQTEPSKKSFRLGEVFQINLQTKIKDGTFEKVELFVDGKLIHTSRNLTNIVPVKTLDFGVGKHLVKASAVKTDGVSGENYEEILVTSDIYPVQYTYQIVAVYPHDPNHFTEGFEFYENRLYESTGQEGTSGIYELNLKSGSSNREYKMDDQYFGEGITILNNKIYQLTYRNQIGFVYDLNSLKILNTWNYKSKEGWGMTNDGKSIIMSDGTENVCYINPDNYMEIKKIQVCNDKDIVKNINELEYIKGEIWANIWTTDTIIIFDPNTGKVTGEIDLGGLSGSILKSQREKINELNGIAWNKKSDKIYVTGKLWPNIFEIKLIKKGS